MTDNPELHPRLPSPADLPSATQEYAVVSVTGTVPPAVMETTIQPADTRTFADVVTAQPAANAPSIGEGGFSTQRQPEVSIAEPVRPTQPEATQVQVQPEKATTTTVQPDEATIATQGIHAAQTAGQPGTTETVETVVASTQRAETPPARVEQPVPTPLAAAAGRLASERGATEGPNTDYHRITSAPIGPDGRAAATDLGVSFGQENVLRTTHDWLSSPEGTVLDRVTADMTNTTGLDSGDVKGLAAGTDLAVVRGLTIVSAPLKPEAQPGDTEQSDQPGTDLAVVPEVATNDDDSRSKPDQSPRRSSRWYAMLARETVDGFIKRPKNVGVWRTADGGDAAKINSVYRTAYFKHLDEAEAQAAVVRYQWKIQLDDHNAQRAHGNTELPVTPRPWELTQAEQTAQYNEIIRHDGSENLAHAAVTHAVREREERIHTWDRNQALKKDSTLNIPPIPRPHELTRAETEAVYELAFQKEHSLLAANGAQATAIAERQHQIELWDESYLITQSGFEVVQEMIAQRNLNMVTRDKFLAMDRDQQEALINALNAKRVEQNLRPGGPSMDAEAQLIGQTLQMFTTLRDRLRFDRTGRTSELAAGLKATAANQQITGYNPDERTAILFSEGLVDASALVLAYMGDCTQIVLAGAYFKSGTMAALRARLPHVNILAAHPYLDTGIEADVVVVRDGGIAPEEAFAPLREGGAVIVSGAPSFKEFRDGTSQHIANGDLPGVSSTELVSGKLAVGAHNGGSAPSYMPYQEPGYLYRLQHSAEGQAADQA